MAKSGELETLIYCLGPVGGQDNPVISSGLYFNKKEDYTTLGYQNYIKEAKNAIKFHYKVIDYFLASVRSEHENLLSFIDAESQENLQESIKKMRTHWGEMFKEHQKHLRETLKKKASEKPPPIPKQVLEESSDDSSNSSSAKIQKLNPEAALEASGSEISESTLKATGSDSSGSTLKHSKSKFTEPTVIAVRSKIPESAFKAIGSKIPESALKASGSKIPESSYSISRIEFAESDFDRNLSSLESGATESTYTTRSHGVPVDSFEFPESIFKRKAKEFGRVLKTEFLSLKARLGKALDKIPVSEGTVRDLEGFTLLKMKKFAKWKYALKTLDILVPDLEEKLNELDLDFEIRKPNEKRLTDWMYFDDGKKDRKYYHRLLIPMELTGEIEEISALLWKQMRRWWKLNNSLADKLPNDRKTYGKQMKQWQYEILYGRPMHKPLETADTLSEIGDIPKD